MVAGGYAGQDVGHRVETEAYNMETSTWLQLASLPHENFTVDMSFVWNGKLFARGYNQAGRFLNMVSYDLESNTWREEADKLKHFEPMSPPLSLNGVAVRRSDNNLFFLEVVDCNISAQAETEPVVLKIMKLNVRSGKWQKVCRVLDEVMHYDCECAFERDVRFLSTKNHVIFLTHSEEEEDIEVEQVSKQHPEV